ncbi:MAG: tetratricopeptide repeat protein [Longimicrobiales bacterium]
MKGRVPVWSAMALLSLMAVQPVFAQRPGRQSAAREARASVRAELAGVLLQARRYDEAAREFATLVARDPGNVGYRMGLARALAWGKRPRQAEEQLRILSRWRPNDREVESLLRSVRQSIEPRVDEAATWVEERPSYAPYRRALARALVRDGEPKAALPYYETLLATDTTAALRREAVDAHIASRAYPRALALLYRSIEHAPRDTAVRHTLASTLFLAHQDDAALTQYDTLIAWYPAPALLLERARLNARRRDLTAAEADVNASIRGKASAGAYLLLGDLHRWRGEFEQARSAYGYARQLAPDQRAVLTALGQLAREERPIVAFLPDPFDDQGWQLRTSSVSDNEGMSYARLGARRAVLFRDGLSASVDMELQRMAERPPALGDGAGAFALRVGLAHVFRDGAFQARLSGQSGMVNHAQGALFAGGVSATGWVKATALSVQLATGPAYPSLLTIASMRPPDNAPPLSEQTFSAALGGPMDRADVALSAQRANISDGNRRSSVQVVVRVPLAARLSAISLGQGIWFADRSELYWDPLAYLAGALGLELSTGNARALSFAARVLAGPARTLEVIVNESRSREARHDALNLHAGGELVHRSQTGELAATITYGSGRTGVYRRLEIGLQARLAH